MKHKTRVLFHRHTMHLSAILVLLQTKMSYFLTFSYNSTREIPTLSYI